MVKRAVAVISTMMITSPTIAGVVANDEVQRCSSITASIRNPLNSLSRVCPTRAGVACRKGRRYALNMAINSINPKP